jgi:hypothetical protein
VNWDAIGAIGEIVGAVAVVLSLIYLASQIRQNTNSTQGSNELDVTNNLATWISRASLDPMLREATDKIASGTALSNDEKLRFAYHAAELIQMSEGWYQQYQRGLMSEQIWFARLDGVLGLLNQDVVEHWWDTSVLSLSQDFKDYINAQRSKRQPNFRLASTAEFAEKT